MTEKYLYIHSLMILVITISLLLVVVLITFRIEGLELFRSFTD